MNSFNFKIRIIFSVIILSVFIFSPRLIASEKILSYKIVFRPFYGEGGRLGIAVREFYRGSKPQSLVVDPYTFKTRVVNGLVDTAKKAPKKAWEKTPFIKALTRYTAGGGLQNEGIREGEGSYKGVFLTADMCPSRRPFDKDLFTSTMDLPGLKEPANIALAVSGLWIERHREEFNWIRDLEKSGKLNITWINHTYSHPYDRGKPLEENFLLARGVDFEKEVLYNEVVMLENGITPSPFFRFPGLVSDKRLMARLRELSLIPVGANAWLAKGEVPVNGSIILVHGNGNEPQGIKDLRSFYKARSGDFRDGSLKALPITEAFTGRR